MDVTTSVPLEATIVPSCTAIDAVQTSQLAGSNPPYMRACEECKRKKTRCNMVRPRCASCARAQKPCIYPVKRKSPRPRGNTNSSDKKCKSSRHDALDAKLDYLIEIVTNGEALQDQSLGGNSIGSSSSDRNKVNSPSRSVRPNTPRHNANLTVDLGWTPISPLLDANLSTSENPFACEMFEADLSIWNDDYDPVLGLEIPGPLPAVRDSPACQELTTNLTPVSNNDGLQDRVETPQEPIFSFPEPPAVIDQLIDLFFAKVHGFLPIFDRSRTKASLNLTQGEDGRQYQDLPFHTAFVLNGMLSLAARFSTSPFFGETVPRERGDVFATRAKQMYQNFIPENYNFARNLRYLQGCILLAFYNLSSIPEPFGWHLTGDCIRLAYDLELDKTDADVTTEQLSRSGSWLYPENWVLREEKRRAWWSVWELDSFLSTLSNWPYAIDQQQMRVLLPSPDANWQSNSPIASRFLASDISLMWKSLQDCPNQDVRAWFLVAKGLMLQVHATSRRSTLSSKAVETLDSALSCFCLLLPEDFQVDAGVPTFNQSSFQRDNWIIAIHILLQSSHAMMFLMYERLSQVQAGVALTSPELAIPRNEKWLARCRQCTRNVCTAIKIWPSQYIPLCSPFMVVSLVGPSAIHLRMDIQPDDRPMEQEILELAISRFAKHWKIGLLVSNVAKALKLAKPNQTPSFELDTADVIKRIITILP